MGMVAHGSLLRPLSLAYSEPQYYVSWRAATQPRAHRSIPGLLILYAGLMKRKWTYNTAFLVFYTFALVLICWVVWVYKMVRDRCVLPSNQIRFNTTHLFIDHAVVR